MKTFCRFIVRSVLVFQLGIALLLAIVAFPIWGPVIGLEKLWCWIKKTADVG